MAPGPVAMAEQALALAAADPEGADRLAREVMASAAGVAEVATIAERARGVAARMRGDLVGADSHLRRAVEVAEDARLGARAAEARITLAPVAAAMGSTDEALHMLDVAARRLHGAPGARARAQKANLLARLGRFDEALTAFRRALAALRRADDLEGQAQVLTGRGLLLAYRGDYRAAEVDLQAAESYHLRLARPVDAAGVRHNLGFVASRRGDVPTALRWFDAAETEWRQLGVSQPATMLDRCETLLAVRLVAEARSVGRAAMAELEAAGAETDLADARLLMSQAALLDGDRAEAADLARLAHSAFVHQRRAGWAALARYAGLRALWTEGDHSGGLAAEAAATVNDLVIAGWASPAQDARLIAARIALDAGRSEESSLLLRAASAARFRGPADVRARAWHAEALVRRARGDGRGADAALRAGVRVLARNRATLGATELRVHAAARVADLGNLGMRMALESGRARRVLSWAERLRADLAHAWRPPRPPDDAQVADHLAELRHVVSQLEAAGFAGEDPGRLLERQATLEGLIRGKTRHAVGEGKGDEAPPPSVAELAAGMGDRALVEVVECDGQLAAVSLIEGRARLHTLGSEADATRSAHTLRFALGRLARTGQSPRSQQAAVAMAVTASSQLDHLMFGAVRRRIGARSMVLVPTGRLHAVPWSSLPSCRDRPVVVAPSAASWLQADRAEATSGAARISRGRRNGGGTGPMDPAAEATVLVAGPGLAQADGEVADLAAVHPPATTLKGGGATTGGFLRAADGARLVHVAAHGRFRADNPLLSSLRLADGPLTVYDLERLHRAPRQLVLSACEAGLSANHSGDELMGLAASLLGLGTRSLVASVVPVRDATTRPLMVNLHGHLVEGTPPADALALAMAASRDEGPDSLSAVGFVCFGAG